MESSIEGSLSGAKAKLPRQRRHSPFGPRGISNLPQATQVSAVCVSLFSAALPTALFSGIVISSAVPHGYQETSIL